MYSGFKDEWNFSLFMLIHSVQPAKGKIVSVVSLI